MTPPTEKLSAQEKNLLDEFNRLPPSTQKIIVKLIRDLATQALLNETTPTQQESADDCKTR